MIELPEKFLHIKPYIGGNLGAIQKVAQLDNHTVMNPTQVIERNGEIIGALEISSSVPVLVWMDTKKTTIRDSIEVMRFYENFIFAHNVPNKTILLPCSLTSPYIEYLRNPKLGYISGGNFELFVKKAN